MSQIDTEMGQDGTMTAMMEEETATEIAMTTGTAETTTEVGFFCLYNSI